MNRITAYEIQRIRMVRYRHTGSLTGCAVLLVLCIARPPQASAQEHAFVPVGDWTYTYVERLQRRGHLLELNPTALPYTRGDLREVLARLETRRLSSTERKWVELLRAEFRGDDRRHPDEGRRGRDDEQGRRGRAGRDGYDGRQRDRGNSGGRVSPQASIGVAFAPGLRTANAERLDALRPDGSSDPTLEAGAFNLFPNAGLHGYIERGRVIAHAGVQFDVYYRDDPDGLDAANRLITRNAESYVGFNGRFASVYLGRIGRHWAPPGSSALMLSDNAVSMDQLAFRIGGERLSWQGLLGELDSATPDGEFTGTAGADTVGGSIRRYLATHRVDWRPSRRFGLSIMESTLYSGPNSGASVKYLNPLLIHIFSVDGRPKNDENNGLVAGLLWAQIDRWTLTAQLMLDDFDILGESGEPASAALTGTLTYAGLPRADLGVSATAVTARAYNTHQAEGRYIYLNRGLATAFNDFVHLAAFAPLYLDHAFEGLTLTPKFDVLWQGERDFREPYPGGSVDMILDGTAETVLRPALELRVQRQRTWWLRIDVGPNLVSNADHRNGVDATTWTVLAEFGARLQIDRRFGLSF